MIDITQAYTDECLRSASPLRTTAQTVHLPGAMRRTAGARLFPRPLFVDSDDVDRFAADVVRVFDLIISLPDRLFGGDLDAYCTRLHLPRDWKPLVCRFGGTPPPRYGRADMYHDGTSFKLLEFNIESDLGGADQSGEIPAAFLLDPAFARFAVRHGLTHVHTGHKIAGALRAAGSGVSGGRAPVVAVLQLNGIGHHDDDWLSLRDVLCAEGVECLVGDLREVEHREGKPHLRNRPVDVVLRGFTAHDIVTTPDAEEAAESLFLAHETGTVVLWIPLEANLFSNKACLAMLSDTANRARFSSDELEVIDRVVPWTRALGPDSTPDFLAELRKRKPELVLKPNSLYGGIGVVAGWASTDQEWDDALEIGSAFGCVVQQRVVPREEPLVTPDGRIEQWHAAYGLFVTPDGGAGVYARLLPSKASSVIAVTSNEETRITGVFTR